MRSCLHVRAHTKAALLAHDCIGEFAQSAALLTLLSWLPLQTAAAAVVSTTKGVPHIALLFPVPCGQQHDCMYRSRRVGTVRLGSA